MPSPVQTLTYVDVDDGPIDGFRTMMQNRMVLNEDYDGLPDDFHAALLRVVDEGFDSSSCEATECDWRGDGRSGPAPVGYGLAGDADEIQTFATFTLVKRGDSPVIAVCEQCSPGALYTRDEVIPATDPSLTGEGTALGQRLGICGAEPPRGGRDRCHRPPGHVTGLTGLHDNGSSTWGDAG